MALLPVPSWWNRQRRQARIRVPLSLLGLCCFVALLPLSATFCNRPAFWGSSDLRRVRRGRENRESHTQLQAAAAPIARRKKGDALVKRVPPPSVKVTKLKKGERYRGYINPKLKALVQAPEYRKVVDLLARLENETKLDTLLASAQEYWENLNIYEISLTEQEQGRRAVSKIIRRDWSRIWPKELESTRLEAYDLFSAFWRRLEQSQIIDAIIGEVIPDLKRGYENPMDREGQDRLLKMSDSKRLLEFHNRFNESVTAYQYRILAENDTAIPVLSQKLLPFFVRGIDNFEYKLANTPLPMPGFANVTVGATIAIGFVLVLALSGVIELPSLEEKVSLERTSARRETIVAPAAPAQVVPPEQPTSSVPDSFQS